jgi:hypothetical protein
MACRTKAWRSLSSSSSCYSFFAGNGMTLCARFGSVLFCFAGFFMTGLEDEAGFDCFSLTFFFSFVRDGEASFSSPPESSAKRSYLMPIILASAKDLSDWGNNNKGPWRFLSYPIVPNSVPDPCDSPDRLMIFPASKALWKSGSFSDINRYTSGLPLFSTTWENRILFIPGFRRLLRGFLLGRGNDAFGENDSLVFEGLLTIAEVEAAAFLSPANPFAFLDASISPPSCAKYNVN